MARWTEGRESAVLAALMGAGILLRALLLAYSPQPYGYVWDFYHEGIRLLYATGSVPASTDCWQCYHPPLFYLSGWTAYAFQRWLHPGPDDSDALRAVAALSLAWAGITIAFGWKLLRLFRCRGTSMALGAGLLLLFPCLLISSFGAEADMLVTAIGSAIAYYLTRYFIDGQRTSAFAAARLGLLGGLAASTKYSGLVLVAAIATVLALRVAVTPGRARTLRDAVIVFGLCAALGGWKYVDNVRRYGTPLFANGEAARGFSVESRRALRENYDFTSFHLGQAMQLFPPDPPTGRLTRFPVYHSVFTTLHALAWTDMSMFSVPGRHGDRSRPYPEKRVARWLIRAELALGIVPESLAVIGFLVALRRRSLWPLILLTVVSIVAYGMWFTAQEQWALKTKYLLFLLPPGVLFAMVGLGWLRRRAPFVGTCSACALGLLLIVTPIYLYQFAVGSA
jgi:hypothetical protein